MLGTLYPLFLDALNLGKISVGPPYFDAVFVPVMTPLVFLMGVGPLARWKEAKLPDLWQRLKWALAVSLVTALLLPFAAGSWKPLVSFGLLLAFGWYFPQRRVMLLFPPIPMPSSISSRAIPTTRPVNASPASGTSCRTRAAAP